MKPKTLERIVIDGVTEPKNNHELKDYFGLLDELSNHSSSTRIFNEVHAASLKLLATRGERKGILGRIYVYANGDEHYGLHIEHYYGLVTDIMLIAYECNGKMRSFELRRGRGNLSRKKMERENMVDSMVRGRTLTGTLKEIFQYEPYMLGIRAEKAEPRTIKYG